jgi:hypothetical protein
MKPYKRACVAYTAGRLISQKVASMIYDYTEGKYVCLEGEINPDKIDIYDYETECNFEGECQHGVFSIYNSCCDQNIELIIKGQKFNGYDFGESCHFSGNVNSDSITLYDCEDAIHHDYSLHE